MLMRLILTCLAKLPYFNTLNRCNAEKAKLLLARRLLQPLSKEDILLQTGSCKRISRKPFVASAVAGFWSINQKYQLKTERSVFYMVER
jgi:hypothetical protein